jgi:hypothetical protein
MEKQGLSLGLLSSYQLQVYHLKMDQYTKIDEMRFFMESVIKAPTFVRWIQEVKK